VINSIIQSANEAAHNVKLAASTSLATATTGTITWLEWIPPDIGKLATIFGLALSSILIYTHIKKAQRDKELHIIEMAKKTLELEMLQARAKRK
jgi:hypothetical protein